MKFYNDLTRQKQEFKPIKQGEVSIYSCGPTVYNYFHIGNARPFIVFDALRSYLEYLGYKVNFVQNFTDVDDKIINKANAEGVSFEQISERYINEYFTDAKGLGIKPATVHPKATENIDAMIDIIQTLIDKGYAYAVNGDVYYRTTKFKDYGKLSHMPIEDLESGIRVDVSEQKENPLDFALWKASKEGEPYWQAPWGKGRPGWHIECSAMSNRYLGKTIDIHGGGQDLTFPHHENEIAQSEAANGVEFAHFWLHNAYININNQKMSKSKNNFFTVRDIANDYGYAVMRFFLLSAHYRSPINFSAEIMEQAKAGLARLTTCRDNLEFIKNSAADGDMTTDEKQSAEKIKGLEKNYFEALDDDFNTADALAALFEIAREANSLASGATKAYVDFAYEVFDRLGGILNIWIGTHKQTLDSEIDEMIEKRNQARKDKDFKTADEIRDKLKEMNIVLEDTPAGVKWHRG